MTAVLTTIRATPPAPLSPSLANTVARLTNAVEETGRTFSISKRFAPTDAERDALSGRLAALNAALDSCGAREAARLIVSLLHAFPHGKTSAEDAQRTVLAYGEALAGTPGWALQAAVDRFRRGEVDRENHTFAPSVAELRRECERIAADVHAEARQLRRILAAKVYDEPSPKERERVAAVVEQLAEQLRSTPDGRAERAREAAKRSAEASDRLIAAELARAGIDDGLKLSVEMRNKLAGWKAEADAYAALNRTPNAAQPD